MPHGPSYRAYPRLYLFANSLRCNGASAAEGRPSVARLASSRQPVTQLRPSAVPLIALPVDSIQHLCNSMRNGVGAHPPSIKHARVDAYYENRGHLRAWVI